MKRYFIAFLIAGIIFSSGILILNTEVITRQGINYEVRQIKIPLYLKVLDFMDRHYNYKSLTRKITENCKTQQDKVIKIFSWTYDNIKRQPGNLPVVDDHVWHIIVRGYGVDDQFQDVFTTLCNYAKVDSFFDYIYNNNKERRKCLSFVKLNDRWTIFDVYNGVYFKNREGQIASIEDLSAGNWLLIREGNNIFDENYDTYFKRLRSYNYIDKKFSRPTLQSPLRRFIFWCKGLFH
ncbi:MAG: transglutaminase-like domain-containing protein [Candidatus Omnitrophota bacterium]|jgi:hypothetical protein